MTPRLIDWLPHLTLPIHSGRWVIWGTHTLALFMRYTPQQLKNLELTYLKDYERGLLTRTQLLNMLHRLDRISHIVWLKRKMRSGYFSMLLSVGFITFPNINGLHNIGRYVMHCSTQYKTSTPHKWKNQGRKRPQAVRQANAKRKHLKQKYKLWFTITPCVYMKSHLVLVLDIF